MSNVVVLGLSLESKSANTQIYTLIARFDELRQKCESVQETLNKTFGGSFRSGIAHSISQVRRLQKEAEGIQPVKITSGNNASSIGKTALAVANSGNAVKSLNAEFGKITTTANSATAAVGKLGAAPAAINTAPLQKFNTSLHATEQHALSVADNLLQAFGSASVFNYLKKATALSIEFGVQIAYITTLAREFDPEKLSSGLMSFDSALGTPAQNAKALYYAYSSGVSGSEADLVSFTKSMSELAIVIRADVVSTMDAATSAMNAYGLSAKDAGELSDLFFSIVKYGKASGAQLATGLGQVISTSATAELSLNEMGAAVTSLTKVMQTRNAITFFNNMLSKMIKPTKEAQQAAKALGIELGLNALRAKGFSEMMQEIREKTQGNQESLLRIFPDLRGQRAALQLLNKGWGDFQGQLSNFENKAGAASEAMEKLSQDTNFQLMNIPVTLNKIGQQSGQILTDFLTMGGALTPLIADFNKMEDFTQKSLASLALAAGGYLLLKSAMSVINIMRSKAAAKTLEQALLLIEENDLRIRVAETTQAQIIQEERLAVSKDKSTLAGMKANNSAIKEISAIRETNGALQLGIRERGVEIQKIAATVSQRDLETFSVEKLAIAQKQLVAAKLNERRIIAQCNGVNNEATIIAAEEVRKMAAKTKTLNADLNVRMRNAGIKEAQAVIDMKLANAADAQTIAKNNSAIASIQESDAGLKNIAAMNAELKTRTDNLRVQAMELNQQHSLNASKSMTARADAMAMASRGMLISSSQELLSSHIAERAAENNSLKARSASIAKMREYHEGALNIARETRGATYAEQGYLTIHRNGYTQRQYSVEMQKVMTAQRNSEIQVLGKEAAAVRVLNMEKANSIALQKNEFILSTARNLGDGENVSKKDFASAFLEADANETLAASLSKTSIAKKDSALSSALFAAKQHEAAIAAGNTGEAVKQAGIAQREYSRYVRLSASSNRVATFALKERAYTERAALATSKLSVMWNKIKAVSCGGVATGYYAIATAATVAGAAVKAFLVAAWPMLLIGALIFGVTALFNALDLSGSKWAERISKNINDVNDKFDKLIQNADKVIEKTKTKAASGSDIAEKLTRLSKYEELTNEGREAALDLIKQINDQYGDVGVAYDESNKKLIIQGDLLERINRLNVENIGAAQKGSIAPMEQKVADLVKIRDDALSAAEESLKAQRRRNTREVMRQERLQAEKSLGAGKDGENAVAPEEIEKIDNKIEAYNEAAGALADAERELFEKRKESAEELRKIGDKSPALIAANEEAQKLKDKLVEAQKAADFDKMTDYGKIQSLSNDIAGMSKNIIQYNQNLDAGIKPLSDQKSWAELIAQSQLDIFNIQQNKIGLLNKLAESERNANNATLQMIQSMDKFKSTAVSAVNANSAQAIELQSRRFDAPPALNPAVAAQSNLNEEQKKLATSATTASGKVETLRKSIDQISIDQMVKNISGVGDIFKISGGGGASYKRLMQVPQYEPTNSIPVASVKNDIKDNSDKDINNISSSGANLEKVTAMLLQELTGHTEILKQIAKKSGFKIEAVRL